MVYLLPLITTLIWGANTIINKMASVTIEPSSISFYRWFLAVLLMSPFCLKPAIKQWNIIKSNLAKIACLALLGMVLNQSLAYYAGLTTSASNMALITSLVPLISVFLSVPILNKTLSPISVVSGVIALAGLALMLGKGDITFFIHSDVTIGDLIMLMSACCYAAYCVLLKRWKMPLSNGAMVYAQASIALIMLLPLLLSSKELLPSTDALPLIAFAGIGASLIAPWLWVKAIDRIGADTSAMFMNLIPVISIVLAATLLGEKIHSYHLVGGVMVISSVILSQVKLKRKNKQPLHHINHV